MEAGGDKNVARIPNIREQTLLQSRLRAWFDSMHQKRFCYNRQLSYQRSG